MFKAVKRGRYEQLTTIDGTPVVARLAGCTVAKVTESNGKRYATLDASCSTGDRQLLLDVDDFIRTRARPRFSPMRMAWACVTTKDEVGVEPGSVVDVELTPGAFGSFGWCLLLKRVVSQTFPE